MRQIGCERERETKKLLDYYKEDKQGWGFYKYTRRRGFENVEGEENDSWEGL